MRPRLWRLQRENRIANLARLHAKIGTFTKTSRNSRRVPVLCVETGEVWASGKEAAEAAGVKSQRLHKAMTRGRSIGGKHYRRAG